MRAVFEKARPPETGLAVVVKRGRDVLAPCNACCTPVKIEILE